MTDRSRSYGELHLHPGNHPEKTARFPEHQATTGTVLAVPRSSLAQGQEILRFIPQNNLSSRNAAAGTQHLSRNAAMMV